MKSNVLRRPLLLAAACCLPLLPARGQDAGSQVSMRLDLVAWGDDIPGLSLKTATKTAGVTAISFRYSTPVAYSGPQMLEIYQNKAAKKEKVVVSDPQMAVLPIPETPEKSKDSQDVPPLLAKLREKNPDLVALAMLPATSRRATVLLGPGPAGTYQAYVIDDDPTKLPTGRLRVHNLSSIPVQLRFNSKTSVELKTRDTAVAEPENNQVVYELAYRNGDEWKLQENNLLRVTEQEQVQFVILKSAHSFFMSSDGSRSGFLQTVILRRQPNAPIPAASNPSPGH